MSVEASVRQPVLPVSGLSEEEAQARRERGLGNTVTLPTSRSYRQIVTENVFTFINLSLLGLGLALALLGRLGDALISTAVISLNVLVSLVQEVRAKRTLDRIALLTRPMASVIREGRRREVAPEEVVAGDVLVVGPGDQIVVDGRIIGDGPMAVDESLLTGEADLITKRTGDPVYSGSFCVSGEGYYEAERVGNQSFAHQMTASARAFRRVLTPLQREIYLVVRIALLIVVYLEFLLVITSLLQHINLADSVENSTIVAGLVPNGLFLSIAVAYAVGAVRILRFGALIQQANAIESLSHVDVLCVDKTGTLTANRLEVHGLHALGVGAEDLGHVLGTMAASASGGNKTSAALAVAWPVDAHPVVAEVPFSPARKWSALAFNDAGGRDGRALRGVYALGAPEMLRAYLAVAPDGTPEHWQDVEALTHELAEQGLRVLLVARASAPSGLEDRGDESVLPGGMEPLGLVSLRDELRPEARETLAAFREAGVRLKIISGDNPETVAALARQAGLDDAERFISGPELERMDEAQFAAAAESATIFGRITPQQKERLVGAFRQQGHYVAMIGDGVNDVLSLKRADLGIAMRSGSQAARGVADVVLMQDSFAVLVPAVEEGQRIINGMQDILKLFLTRISTVGVVIFSSLVVGAFPLELRQGSLVTLFSVGIPAVLLAVWARPGPTPQGGLVRRLLHFILPPVLITSALGLLLFVSMYVLGLLPYPGPPVRLGGIPALEQFAAAQTALAIYLVFCGLFLVIFVEPPSEWWVGGSALSTDRRPAWLAVSLMALFLLINLVPALRQTFSLSALSFDQYVLVSVVLGLWLSLVRMSWRARVLERFLGVRLG